ncbi:MAG: glycoside hydrolase family 2 TIM barrel-domain containing protein [Candidatus Brocadiaceae bacterium]|jgi:beta-galactosidase/beta-glucuronidase
MAAIPRPEHPRPDRRRDDDWWLNLNGEWQFEIDPGVSGEARGYATGRNLSGSISVPFCPESRLSGVGNRDFLNCVWYRRFFEVPESWKDRRVLLHVGACDYATTVWLNGCEAGRHEGGYTPFCVELTDSLTDGRNELVIRAVDLMRDGFMPRGKQSPRYESFGCLYTRTTGIWQTVWLEAVPRTRVDDVVVRPDLDRGLFSVRLAVRGGGPFEGVVSARAPGEEVGRTTFKGRGAVPVRLELALEEARPWSPEDPFLYEIVVELTGQGGADRLTTWAGLRKFHVEGNRFFLNDEPLFLRTVLDQGFYPDGVYTAPTMEALEGDVEAALAFGFNGARLHQKVFEPLFLHLCDRKGYLVFGEFPDWGHPMDDPRFVHAMLDQWAETVCRDLGHPSIIGWCPLNESGDADRTRYGEWLSRRLYRLTKALDPARPVIDASGWFHFETDVWDTHNYQQDVERFADAFEPLAGGDYGAAHSACERQLPYDGRRPYFVSEFGGIAWSEGDVPEQAWGYGSGPATKEEFIARFRGLAEVLLNNPGVAGFCYTQLTDVEQEINGLLTYDRRPKFPAEQIAAILSQEAVVE